MTYEFECDGCKIYVELEMTINDYDPSKDYLCPYCMEKLRRVITTVNFQLNGPGWFNSGGY